MLPNAAFVCALLALFSAESQGNKVNHDLAARKERVVRFVNKPAVFRRDSGTCLPESHEHYRRLTLLACDEKYIQAVFNEIETSNCNNHHYDGEMGYPKLFYGCSTNHNGDVCGGIEDSILYNDLYDQCFSPFYTLTSNCSSECRSVLSQLSDSVGCCIHDSYYASMPSVWTDCNLQQPEVCADTRNIEDILAKRDVDTCPWECSLRQVYYVFCKNLGEGYEQINRECGVEDVVNICGFDKGEFCILMKSTRYFEAISNKCYSDESSIIIRDAVCYIKCKNVLIELVDTAGCCVNFFSRDKYEGDLVLSAFSACGMKIPNACNSFTYTAVPDDFLDDCVNGGHRAALQSGVYSIGLILIATYIM